MRVQDHQIVCVYGVLAICYVRFDMVYIAALRNFHNRFFNSDVGNYWHMMSMEALVRALQERPTAYELIGFVNAPTLQLGDDT